MDISLRTCCAALVTAQHWQDRSDAYTRARWPHLISELADEEVEKEFTVLVSQSKVWVTPDGRARIDTHFDGDIPVFSTEIVTPRDTFHLSKRSDRVGIDYVHQSRPQVGIHRQIEDYFGRPYPNAALALLNPLLLLRDYVCVSGTNRMSKMLEQITSNYRLVHNPAFPINATDDPERLGSMTVDVTFTLAEPLMLLSWSALHNGKPFSTTRVTWLRQGVEFDPAIFTDPRVPAPSLPFD